MNPGKEGWLEDFFEFRKGGIVQLSEEKSKSAHPEQALYRLIQPTGLMYGQSIVFLEHPNAQKWGAKDKLKVLLTECLLGSALVFYSRTIKTEQEAREFFQNTIKQTVDFYNQVFPELATSPRTLFGRTRTNSELLEILLDKRIKVSQENFWISFFHNSLLFLDVYVFSQWLHTSADKLVSDFLQYQRVELRFSVVKVIASAAHANNTVEFEERKLLDHFLESANLDGDKKREARAIFDKGAQVEDISLPSNNSWILRKFFLEIAILTVWADKHVEETELHYIQRLAKHLKLTSDELESSLMALEGFILQYWQELTKLQNPQAFDQVSELFINRVLKATTLHKQLLVKEARFTKPLLHLLKEAQGRELQAHEKNDLRNYLIEILKVLPNFSTITLPQRFFTQNNLMRAFPPDFFSEVLKGG